VARQAGDRITPSQARGNVKVKSHTRRKPAPKKPFVLPSGGPEPFTGGEHRQVERFKKTPTFKHAMDAAGKAGKESHGVAKPFNQHTLERAVGPLRPPKVAQVPILAPPSFEGPQRVSRHEAHDVSRLTQVALDDAAPASHRISAARELRIRYGYPEGQQEFLARAKQDRVDEIGRQLAGMRHDTPEAQALRDEAARIAPEQFGPSLTPGGIAGSWRDFVTKDLGGLLSKGAAGQLVRGAHGKGDLLQAEQSSEGRR
jgi:hypothetical protein